MQQSDEVQELKRFGSIDLIKTIAVFSIVCIHVCAGFGSYSPGTDGWNSFLFWGSLARAGVPLFLMCSGALMLNPGKTLGVKRLWSKNILRLLAALFFWAFCYGLFHLLRSGNLSPASALELFKDILLFRHEQHLYYIHIMLLVYAFLPVTRLFAAHAQRSQLLYFLCIWFLLGIVFPTVRPFYPFNLLKGIPLQWLINAAYSAIGYGVLGHYLARYAKPNPRHFVPLATTGFVMVFGGTYLLSARAGTFFPGLWEGMSVGVCLYAAGIFGLCLGAPSLKMSEVFSKASFCIYLSHMFFIYEVRTIPDISSFLPAFIFIPLVTVVAVAGSVALYFGLSRIPIIKDWLI